MPYKNYFLFPSAFMGALHFGLGLAATFQSHHQLGKLDLSIPSHLHLTQKLPPNPLRPKPAAFSLILQILCASVLHCPCGHGIPQLDRQFLQVGPWLLALQGSREGRCCSLGCSELQEHSGGGHRATGRPPQPTLMGTAGSEARNPRGSPLPLISSLYH